MAARLSRVVHVIDREGNPRMFGPGDDVPDWARAKITNPAAWGDDSGGRSNGAANGGSPSAPTGPGPAPSAPSPAPAPAPSPAPAPVPQQRAPEGPVIPPLQGRGSSAVRWRAYAAENGVDLDEDIDRDSIIAELRRRGVRVQ